MLWCNFVLGANFTFLCLKLIINIIIHYHTPKTNENKMCTKDKIAPQHIYIYIYIYIYVTCSTKLTLSIYIYNTFKFFLLLI